MSAFTFAAVDPSGPAATAAMSAYFAELHARFPGGFDAAGALAEGAAAMGPPSGVFVLAHPVGDPATVAGCGGVQRHDAVTGEIKRMWVAPGCRGAGLGRALLAELERRCADLGYGRVVLDTNATLTEAIAMYARTGYEPIERYNDNPYAHHWFAKRL